ncbi:MAG: acetyl-CoA carboxylase biotin carboxylase subunit [Nitrospinota bacterium]
MFQKILIANRGEIALRIIRACKELGIKSVAVHSTVDANALHVKFADESVCIGPAASSKSYLHIPSIISAAEITGADAIHPGYGFLSENPALPEVCEACGITFIGPTPENIRLMGNKVKAISIMKGAGIPTIPGSDGQIESAEEAVIVADKIGYPIIMKAAEGGGGKGLRVVEKKEDVAKSFNLIKKEIEAAFGEANVYIEKFLINPKHIEFQILGDSSGQIIHLGERDCSIQRRHQKLLEEAPCAIISPKQREKMGKTAVKAAATVGYVSAGTIEFLMDSDGNYYFIEMNTRIQVEHPVTEMVTGVDLVKEQIRIAAGESLKLKQEDVKIFGHSIECRINAEDPDKFIPCPGKITALNFPGGPGIRVDTAIYTDYTVLPNYDSLICKLIVHGIDREDALAKMNRALEEFHVEGIKTTIPFHRKVLANKAFREGHFSTNFISEHFSK